MIAECDGLTTAAQQAECYATAEKIRDEGLKDCECRENIYDRFEEKFEYCDTLETAAQQDQCRAEYEAFLKEALKECDP